MTTIPFITITLIVVFLVFSFPINTHFNYTDDNILDDVLDPETKK